jgi:urea transport system permease protein
MNTFTRLFASLLLLVSVPQAAHADDATFEAALALLAKVNLRSTAAAIDELGRSGAPQAIVVLEALRDGELQVRRADSRVVIAKARETGFDLTDPLSGGPLGVAERGELRKLIVNNAMRSKLRTLIARIALSSEDSASRLAAVGSLFGDAAPETQTLLREALSAERDAEVRAGLEEAIAFAEIDAADPATRVRAVERLSRSMRAEVHTRLAALLAIDTNGAHIEPDAALRLAAEDALDSIEERRAFYGLAEVGFFGLSLGFVLVLAATGLAITFGVMGVINMAHGELMMLGAYTTWVVQQAMPNHLEWSLLVAIPAAFLVTAATGVAIERGVVRRLYGRPLETLLATFGISLILQQAVRTIFSPLNRAVVTPDWMTGQLVVNDALGFTLNRLYIIAFSILVFAALTAVLKFTTLGLQMRAVAQNRAMARCMGVRAGWVDAATFGLGSGVAGLAGVALSQITNVGPNLGQSYIVDSFMVVVFGGVSNLWGTLVGGLSLGMASKVMEPWAGAVLAKIFVLVFIILFIQKRPRGIFPQRGRGAEV